MRGTESNEGLDARLSWTGAQAGTCMLIGDDHAAVEKLEEPSSEGPRVPYIPAQDVLQEGGI